MKSLDLNTAFLDNSIKDEIYITFSKGMKLYKLNTLRVGASKFQVLVQLIKSCFGLKYAMFNLFKILKQFLKKMMKLEWICLEPVI